LDNQTGVGADTAIPFDTWQGQTHSPQEAFQIDTGEGPELTTTALSSNLFFDPPFASLLEGENNTAFAGNDNKLAGVTLGGGLDWSFNGPGSTPQFFGTASLSESLDQGGLLGLDSTDALIFDAAGNTTVLKSNVGDWEPGLAQRPSPDGGTEEVATPLTPQIANVSWTFIGGDERGSYAPALPQILSYDKKTVKAGISLIGKDVRGTITATIKATSAASKFTFTSTNPARATVAEESRVKGVNSTTVTLRVTGVAATPNDKPNGDAYLQALWAGKPTGARIPLVVVVPTSDTHMIGPISLTNTAQLGVTLNGQAATEVRTSLDATVKITIFDQFGQTLDSVYDGNKVVTEQFSNTTEQGLPGSPEDRALSIVEIPITEPDSAFHSGIKLDQLTIDTGTAVPGTFNQMQIQGWQNGTLFLVTPDGRFNNVYSFGRQHVVLIGTQTIRVHGYAVSPNFIRTEEALPNNHPPIPFTATDVAVQAH
jgi:hypothetical protein